MPRAAWLLVTVCVLGCIDTALSLVLDVQNGAVTVEPDEHLSIEVTARLRVGEYALSGDSFTVPRASVFVGETPVAEINLDRPEGFVGRLEPGESVTLTFRGTTAGTPPASARATLCTAGEATVLMMWQAEQQADDPLDPPIMSFGTGEGTVAIDGC